jgi:hypothetical protein
MKTSSVSKPRIVNYVTKEEMTALRKAAQAAGLRTPSQIVGAWMRQKLAGK